MHYVRALRDRARLLALLPRGGTLVLAGLILAMLVLAVVPTAQAAAVGHLVVTLTGPATTDRATLDAAALLALLFLTSQVAWSLQRPLRDLLTRRIDGSVRATIRTLATSTTSLAEVENTTFQDAAARAVDGGMGLARTRSAGTAAAGQLEFCFRLLGAVVAAALLAAFSPMLAVVLLAVSLGVRAILRRQWLHLIDILDADVAGQREVYYLSELAVTGAPHDVRLFGLAGWLTGRFRATAHRVYAASWREMWQVLRRQWLILTLVTGSAALALATPAAAALAGRLTTGQLITSVLAAWGVLSISAMGHEAYDIEYGMRGAQAAADLERAYTRDRALAADGGAPLPLVCAGPPLIVLEDVGFTYPGAEHATLDGLSLTLHPGETVAVVGGNGAGKTTLVKLLSGLYLPQAGRMTIDGTDVTALDRAAWQACVAAVFQDFVRYPLSLRENVAPVAAGDAAVREALHRAGGGDLLDGSAFGLDTLLWREGAGGTDLSGGQWQRVALARALHAVGGGRRLLLLDEPTAHLDVEAEAEFHGRVVRQVSGATTVLVSHRLSTVRPADRIVLMHDGRIAESGTHPELLALNGRYARFYELQTQAFAATGHRTAGRSE